MAIIASTHPPKHALNSQQKSGALRIGQLDVDGDRDDTQIIFAAQATPGQADVRLSAIGDTGRQRR